MAFLPCCFLLLRSFDRILRINSYQNTKNHINGEKCLHFENHHGILYGHSYKEFNNVNKQAENIRLKD